MTAPSSVDPARFLHDQLAGVAGSVTTDADHLHQRSDVRGGGRDLRHPRTASRSRSGPSCATATGTGSLTPAGRLDVAVGEAARGQLLKSSLVSGP